MTLRERIVALEAENAALREKLAVRLRLDRTWQVDLADAIFAVAKNISTFKPDGQMRILLGVAVLYGLIKPDVDDVAARSALQPLEGAGS